MGGVSGNPRPAVLVRAFQVVGLRINVDFRPPDRLIALLRREADLA